MATGFVVFYPCAHHYRVFSGACGYHRAGYLDDWRWITLEKQTNGALLPLSSVLFYFYFRRYWRKKAKNMGAIRKGIFRESHTVLPPPCFHVCFLLSSSWLGRYSKNVFVRRDVAKTKKNVSRRIQVCVSTKIQSTPEGTCTISVRILTAMINPSSWLKFRLPTHV